MEKDDQYNPVNPIFYQFKALDNLVYNLEEYLTNDGINEFTADVYLCPYNVVNDATTPFLQYLLYNMFGFINFIQLGHVKIKDNSIVEQSKTHLLALLSSKCVEFIESNVEYKGVLIERGQLYIFFDLTNCKLRLNDIYRSCDLWFVLPSEILNEQKIAGLEVCDKVCNFFASKLEFCFLYDENRDRYESPHIAYATKHENKTAFTYTFGVTASKSNAIFGANYYFTNFDNCLVQIRTLEEYVNESIVGMIRVALFFKKYKIVENLLTDPVDESDIKKQRYNDPNLDADYEKLIARISDHDGKWTEHYDSIILSYAMLDNGKLMKDLPITCVKSYDQQYPLSYHFVSRKNVEKGIL